MQLLSSLKKGETINICEGITDALAVLAMGGNSLGIVGASGFKEEYMQMLLKFNVILIADNDPAGEKMKNKIEVIFSKYKKKLYLFTPAPYNDIDEYRLKLLKRG
jgi:DNA primase